MIDPRLINIPELDAAEVEALSLALQLKAQLILLDELEARKVAARMGLQRIGVLGVLLDAKAAGHIVAVAPLIERLKSGIRFFVSEPLRKHVLRLARK